MLTFSDPYLLQSTTLKQFQLMYAPNAFRDERFAWRGVIYLNLVRSVRRIVDAVAADFDGDLEDDERPSTALSVRSSERKQHFEELRARLKPLLALEHTLIRLLNGEDSGADDSASIASKEMYVRSGAPWKRAVAKLRGANSEAASPEIPATHIRSGDDPSNVLAETKLDMITLWRDAGIREVLSRRKLRLEESSGFFLDEIDRIAAPNYVPSEGLRDSDITLLPAC
jgi:hypothetical protein